MTATKKIEWKANPTIHDEGYAYLVSQGFKINGRRDGRDHNVGVNSDIAKVYKAWLAGYLGYTPMDHAADMDLRFVAYSTADSDTSNTTRTFVNRAAAVRTGLLDKSVAYELFETNGFIVSSSFKALFESAIASRNDRFGVRLWQEVIEQKLHKTL